MNIKPYKEELRKARNKLVKYQHGEIKPVVTARPWLDSIFGGLLPGSIVVIAGPSGGGKTFEMQRVKNSIMDTTVNPEASDFVWLDNSLEMQTISLVIRDLHKITNKSKKKLIGERFTEEEVKLAESYFEQQGDDRYFINEEPDNPITFEKGCRGFLELHRKKSCVFISIDHMALEEEGSKATIDGIVHAANKLKKEFKNVIFFFLSQLNREFVRRMNEKDIKSHPEHTDIYLSDVMYHIADYMYVSFSPSRFGVNQFSKVNSRIYDYLAEHFGEMDRKDKVSFMTFGRIFYFIIKSREENGGWFPNLFIENIEFEGKDKIESALKSEDKSDNDEDFDAERLFGGAKSAIEMSQGTGFEEKAF